MTLSNLKLTKSPLDPNGVPKGFYITKNPEYKKIYYSNDNKKNSNNLIPNNSNSSQMKNK